MAKLTPVFRAAGTAVYTANNVASPTTLSPTKNASTANGDLMVLVTASRSITATVATPSGWDLATGFPKASGTTSGGKIYIFTRIADGTANDAPSVVWSSLTTGTSGDSCSARILSYDDVRNVQDGTPPAANDAASTTSITIPAHTTSLDKSLVIGVAIRVNDTAHTFTVATFTERTDDHTTTGTGHGTEVSELVKSPAGSSGTATVTPSNTTSSRTLAVSLAYEARNEFGSGAIAVSSAGGATVTAGTRAKRGGALSTTAATGVAVSAGHDTDKGGALAVSSAGVVLVSAAKAARRGGVLGVAGAAGVTVANASKSGGGKQGGALVVASVSGVVVGGARAARRGGVLGVAAASVTSVSARRALKAGVAAMSAASGVVVAGASIVPGKGEPPAPPPVVSPPAVSGGFERWASIGPPQRPRVPSVPARRDDEAVAAALALLL